VALGQRSAEALAGQDEALNHGDEKCSTARGGFDGNGVRQVVFGEVARQIKQEFHDPRFGINYALGFKRDNRPGIAGGER
jgi:hypothetical protein